MVRGQRLAAVRSGAFERPGKLLANREPLKPGQRTVQRQAFGNTPKQAVMDAQAADVAIDITAAAEALRACYAPSEIGAAIKAWDALSNPRITWAALDAASAANPIVRSLAQDRRSAPPRTQNQTCPPYIASFFANLTIYQDMARHLDTDADFVVAFSAHESAWPGEHSQDLHNLFGIAKRGGPNLRYESYQAAAAYWIAHFGPYVPRAQTMDDFVARLRRARYNTRDPYYDTHLRDTLATVQRFKRSCVIE